MLLYKICIFLLRIHVLSMFPVNKAVFCTQGLNVFIEVLDVLYTTAQDGN